MASDPDRPILWRRLDAPGHESARLYAREDQWRLRGTAVFAHQGQPCRLDYVVVCDRGWQTVSGRVAGWVGYHAVEIELAVDPGHRWRLNGDDCPDVAGCLDLDLGFSPSTNLLPIRRLDLAVGSEASVRAAWLAFPSLALQPLDQRYRRLDAATYRYESRGGRFVRDLTVDETGFVTRYPDFWERVDGDEGPRPSVTP
jgi:uncharacterized protein